MIPDSVLRKLAERTQPKPRADRAIVAGDIRRAESGGEERLVLVLKVNSDREDAQITMLHPYPEYATESDIIIDPSVTDLTFPVVAQTGLRGVVWLKDLGRLISSAPVEVLNSCLGPRPRELSGPGLTAGTTFAGPLEARADFKSSELASLARLSGDSTEAALDGAPFAFDVDEVFTALLAPSPDAGQMMQAIVELWATRGDQLVFTLEHVEFLNSKGLLAIDRWESTLDSDGLAFRLGPLQSIIERATNRFGQNEPQPNVTYGERALAGARGSE
jgi:hypothetical protein